MHAAERARTMGCEQSYMGSDGWPTSALLHVARVKLKVRVQCGDGPAQDQGNIEQGVDTI